ncbi:ABC-type sugar transport system ATPase subunit [Pseudomonas sp. JUb42]|uniref:sugar ABC transporter ATP-binding protein n=1 Tax=Pseudomonas sp. JUb42 TaxID=2940611 RepID=UPI002169C27B|nr:sugar ABC transporter ATP-binding protein [Pseudomonas sp. JUb42]MCS3470954.1 ABC-type sugar transport system ATPase subunit [Pseudomonas sp. JUb42]
MNAFSSGAPLAMRARQIRKVYQGTTALKGVDFDVVHGKVNVLIGENGAGKSTLMKILAGIEQPTSGQLFAGDESLTLDNPRQAMALGIGIVHQELNLCPNLSVAENMFMGKERRSRFGRLLLGEQRQLARATLQRMGQDIDVDALVQDLSIGKRQIIEIAKVLVSDVQVLILDEPTSSLSEAEVGILFSLIADLKRQGVSIIYISHRLEELIEIGDHFTVLRDGNLVGTGVRGSVTIDWLVERMIGSQMSTELRAARDPGEQEDAREVLRVTDLEVASERGSLLLNKVSFSVRRGEIVAFYGLMGAGRTELFETLIGLRQAIGGRIELNGQVLPLRQDIAGRIRAGIALVPEDRQKLGLVTSASVRDNLLLANLVRYRRADGLARQPMDADVARMIRELHIKTEHAGIAISSLSGGNQQKVVVGKNLLTEPHVLLLDEPTRGIDIKARRELFEVLDRLAKSGLTILYASSDLGEIIGGADRALVMCQGRITASLSRQQLDEPTLVGWSQVSRKEPTTPAPIQKETA